MAKIRLESGGIREVTNPAAIEKLVEKGGVIEEVRPGRLKFINPKVTRKSAKNVKKLVKKQRTELTKESRKVSELEGRAIELEKKARREKEQKKREEANIRAKEARQKAERERELFESKRERVSRVERKLGVPRSTRTGTVEVSILPGSAIPENEKVRLQDGRVVDTTRFQEVTTKKQGLELTGKSRFGERKNTPSSLTLTRGIERAILVPAEKTGLASPRLTGEISATIGGAEEAVQSAVRPSVSIGLAATGLKKVDIDRSLPILDRFRQFTQQTQKPLEASFAGKRFTTQVPTEIRALSPEEELSRKVGGIEATLFMTGGIPKSSALKKPARVRQVGIQRPVETTIEGAQAAETLTLTKIDDVISSGQAKSVTKPGLVQFKKGDAIKRFDIDETIAAVKEFDAADDVSKSLTKSRGVDISESERISIGDIETEEGTRLGFKSASRTIVETPEFDVVKSVSEVTDPSLGQKVAIVESRFKVMKADDFVKDSGRFTSSKISQTRQTPLLTKSDVEQIVGKISTDLSKTKTRIVPLPKQDTSVSLTEQTSESDIQTKPSVIESPISRVKVKEKENLEKVQQSPVQVGTQTREFTSPKSSNIVSQSKESSKITGKSKKKSSVRKRKTKKRQRLDEVLARSKVPLKARDTMMQKRVSLKTSTTTTPSLTTRTPTPPKTPTGFNNLRKFTGQTPPLAPFGGAGFAQGFTQRSTRTGKKKPGFAPSVLSNFVNPTFSTKTAEELSQEQFTGLEFRPLPKEAKRKKRKTKKVRDSMIKPTIKL